MNIATMHYKNMIVNGESTVVPVTNPETADGTWYTFTDIMPDGHEFGIEMNVTPAQLILEPSFERAGVRALDDYRRKYNVEHP